MAVLNTICGDFVNSFFAIRTLRKIHMNIEKMRLYRSIETPVIRRKEDRRAELKRIEERMRVQKRADFIGRPLHHPTWKG